MMKDQNDLGRCPSGRSGGPSDLSRCASQPSAPAANAWQIGPYRIDGFATIYEGDRRVCEVGSAFTNEHVERDARLIAAAPDLLAALKAVAANATYVAPAGNTNCRFCDNNMDHAGTHRNMHGDDCEIRTVLAAIAKAEGRHD